MKINGTIFDENGNSYAVDNVDIYVGEMNDKLLVKTYMRTIYHHEYILNSEKLVKEGKIIVENGNEPYEPEITLNAITSMRDEIVERFDVEYHDYVINKLGL
tara:strand:- start:5320 stop:5625 length:306 start_codon:yes stop_codon:yes gene_type:complete